MQAFKARTWETAIYLSSGQIQGILLFFSEKTKKVLYITTPKVWDTLLRE